MRDIEHPFLFEERDTFAEFCALSRVDQVWVIGLLIRARAGRRLGIHIPIDVLIAGDPYP